MATRSFAKQLENIDVTEVDSSPIDLGDDLDELMKGSQTSSSTVPLEKTSHKRRRCSNNDDKYAPLLKQLGEIATAIKLLGQSGVDYSQLYNEVMKVDGYDEVSFGSVFDYLVENEKIGKAFMVKSANLKKEWLINL
ncbi:hypothetical protein NL676_008952 [Syzygium grande]|nr:hypothetical protein NL676_008952 [Syzygium grande]